MVDQQPRDLKDIAEVARTPVDEQIAATGIGHSITYAAPGCRGQCRGQDEQGYSTREASDSPAQEGKERGTGRKVIWCPCCSLELRKEEDVAPPLRQLITNVRPPNLAPGLTADAQRYIDLTCLYDVVVLSNIRTAT